MSETRTLERVEQQERTDPLNLAPHSTEAEENVLGSILLNPSAIWDVKPYLDADDFFMLRHGWIYEAIVVLASRNDKGIDTRTIAEELRNRGRLEDVGGEAYLNYLPGTMPTALHAEVYAQIVERAAVRRRLLGAAGAIARLAHDQERDTPDVLNDAQRKIMDVSFRHTASKMRSVAEIGRDLYDKLEAARNNKTDVIGIPSPFMDLDTITGGWQPGQLILVAGRPGMGKSAYCLQAALHAAELGYHVAFFSAEMDAEQINQRIFAQRYGVPMDQQRRMNQEQWAQFLDCMAWWDTLPLHINDTAGLTPLAIARECREYKRTHGQLDLVIVDYLQRYRADQRYQKKFEEVGAIAEALKEMAREFRVPLIAAAQLNRACEQRNDKHPMLSDLAESDTLGREADLVLFPFREGVYTGDRYNPQPSDNVVDLDLAKHRNGETTTLPLIWNGPSMKFNNATRTKIELPQ